MYIKKIYGYNTNQNTNSVITSDLYYTNMFYMKCISAENAYFVGFTSSYTLKSYIFVFVSSSTTVTYMKTITTTDTHFSVHYDSTLQQFIIVFINSLV